MSWRASRPERPAAAARPLRTLQRRPGGCRPGTPAPFPARWALEDPRGRSYFVFWTDGDGKLLRALHMAPADDGQAVAISTPYAFRLRLSVERRRQWGGEVLFYLCPGCHRLRRHLYPWPVIDGRLDRDLKPRCRQCSGLRYPCQGIPGGGPGVEPWDPRAVSDPRMVATEFPRSLVFLPGSRAATYGGGP